MQQMPKVVDYFIAKGVVGLSDEFAWGMVQTLHLLLNTIGLFKRAGNGLGYGAGTSYWNNYSEIHRSRNRRY